jgi:hypothetical protein
MSCALAAGASAGCLVQGSGSKAFDAIASAGMAGAATVAEEVAREQAARNAPLGPERDRCPAWECYASPDMTLEEARAYALVYVNHARSDASVAPLSLDYELSAFAQAGSKQLARDHKLHQHIVDDPSGCTGCAEEQADPAGLAAAPAHDQLDAALNAIVGAASANLDADRAAPGGGSSVLAPRWHRLGVGVVNGVGSDGRMYFTLEFAP